MEEWRKGASESGEERACLIFHSAKEESERVS